VGVRGIRGAITVAENNSEEILQATGELTEQIIDQNQISAEQVAAIFITVTHDLDADFPAKAIRAISNWELVPLMCSNEMPVPGSLEKCIRIMMLVNTDQPIDGIRHVFLREAKRLRPDLVSRNS